MTSPWTLTSCPQVVKIWLISTCVLALLAWTAVKSDLAPTYPILPYSHKQGTSGTVGNGNASSNATESGSKYAFATILTGEHDNETDTTNPYITATRLLTYQLLHSPETKVRSSIPFLVLVTENVDQGQRNLLTKDGATVVPVESFRRDWIQPKWDRWQDMLAKLNLWNLTQYDKIAFFDADSIILRPLDGIFSDQTTALQETVPPKEGAAGNNSALPKTYVIAGVHDRWVERNLPPDPDTGFYEEDNYMNAGFFVLAPSKRLFNYYMSLLDTPNSFDPTYPEQNLLNSVHRTDGRMPWRDLGPEWNKKGGKKKDYDNGTRSIHRKWWVKTSDKFLDDYISKVKAEMDEFFAT